MSSVTLSQLGLAPVIHALITKSVPKALVAAHASPPKPLSPRTKDSAVEEPMTDVSAARSTNPFPKENGSRELGVLAATCTIKRHKIKK
jgi:hypothetical protein